MLTAHPVAPARSIVDSCRLMSHLKAQDKAVTGILLLDSHQVGDRQIGVLGATYSWEIDRKIVESVNIFIIAGGLGRHNVVDAITVV
jgi:phosphoribosylanthranilate isomerase